MRHINSIFSLFLALLACSPQSTNPDLIVNKVDASYDDLADLFVEWRAFENPPLYNGAPDYRKVMFDSRHSDFKDLQNRLMAMDTSGWATNEKVDWTIVWAEMNGYDFNYRILKPWERDPAFYKSLWMYRSDVPAHEGPTHHATAEIWQYDFPLNEESRSKLIEDLNVIPALNKQAEENLTGNARDLWIAGIRTIEFQSQNLALSKIGMALMQIRK